MTVLLAMLFGAVGVGYFVYGRKERRGSLVVAGVGLCVFPYFVSDVWLQLVVGCGLLAVPFLARD